MSKRSKIIKVLNKLKFKRRKPKIIETDGAQLITIVSTELPDQCLAVAWDTDDSGYGFWRIQHVGIMRSKIVSKELRPGEPTPAFYGDVCIKGAGGNDLHTGFGYEDDDIIDEEGQVTNKPLEINIFPVRKR